MRIAIVGHGKSLDGGKKGKEIDSHEIVVRLKGSHAALFTEDFGEKADVLCSSTEIMGTWLKMDAKEFWGYPKKDNFDGHTAIEIIAKVGKPCMIPLQLSAHWNNEFRKMGASHPNFSTGMAAVLFAMHRYEPEIIKLFGFDTLLDPKLVFERTKQIPRSGYGVINHDWETENKLLKRLSEAFEVKIES